MTYFFNKMSPLKWKLLGSKSVQIMFLPLDPGGTPLPKARRTTRRHPKTNQQMPSYHQNITKAQVKYDICIMPSHIRLPSSTRQWAWHRTCTQCTQALASFPQVLKCIQVCWDIDFSHIIYSNCPPKRNHVRQLRLIFKWAKNKAHIAHFRICTFKL